MYVKFGNDLLPMVRSAMQDFFRTVLQWRLSHSLGINALLLQVLITIIKRIKLQIQCLAPETSILGESWDMMRRLNILLEREHSTDKLKLESEGFMTKCFLFLIGKSIISRP